MNTPVKPHGERPSWLIIGALALFAALSGLASWAGRQVLDAPIRSSMIPFKNPSTVAAGSDGTIVVSDSGSRRLVGIGTDGKLRFIVKGEQRQKGFYNGELVGSDEKGNFLVMNSLYDTQSVNTIGQSLISFDHDGRVLSAYAVRNLSQDEQQDTEFRMIYAQAWPGFAAWFFPDTDGVFALHVQPLDGGPELKSRRFEDIDIYNLVDVAYGSPDIVYMLERSGRVLRRSGDDPVEAWFANEGQTRLRFPITITTARDGSVYVLDGKTVVYRLSQQAPGDVRIERVLDKTIAAKAGYSYPIAMASISVSPDGTLFGPNEHSGEILSITRAGRLGVIAGAAISGGYAILRIAIFAGWIITALAALAAIALFFVKIFFRKSHLLLRQLSILLPLTAIVVAAITWFVYADMKTSLETEIKYRLQHLSQLLAAGLPVASLDALDLERGRLEDLLSSNEYVALGAIFDSLVNKNEDEWNANIYPYVYVRRGEDWYIVGGFDYIELYPYAKAEFVRVLETGEPNYYRYSDLYGAWLSSLTPLKREDGSIAAVVEASMSADNLDESSRTSVNKMILGTGGLLVFLVVTFGFFNWVLLSSVKKLKTGASRISGGDFDVTVAISSRDEIQDLGDAFNSMSGEIRNYIVRLDVLSKANARFVPEEFIKQLGRKSITDVGLGDQVLIDMSVLFSDIRSFTRMSETMGPAGTMDMLNDYLSHIGPAVRNAGGFIDKYVGDAIMALFPRKPDDAVDAIMVMMTQLDEFRAELVAIGSEPIESGFGLHCGPLMLGIIGEQERFEGTVIADVVNLASRLESLTKFYGVRALISGSVKDALVNTKRPIRFIDLVRVKGRREPVRLYEIIGDGDPARLAKLATAREYVRGFEEYRAGNLDGAEEAFLAVLAQSPGDQSALILQKRCAWYKAEGLPEGWKGITEFHEK